MNYDECHQEVFFLHSLEQKLKRSKTNQQWDKVRDGWKAKQQEDRGTYVTCNRKTRQLSFF